MISIITPAHNEEQTISQFVSSAIEYLREHKISGEVIVVENGSKDNTPRILQELKKKYRNLKVLNIAEGNKGKALRQGIEVAAGELLITLDTDLWDSDFVGNSRELLGNYDIVVGSKVIAGAHDKRPWFNRALNWGYNFVMKLFFNFIGTETHAKLSFRKSKIMPLVNLTRTGDLIWDTELIIRAERAGLTKIEIPTEAKEIRPRRFSVAKQLMKSVRHFWVLLFVLKPSPNRNFLIMTLALLLGLVFRFYNYHGWFFFNADEEAYAYMIRMTSADGHLPAIGGPIAGTRLYMSPWFLYFGAFWYLFSNHHPLFLGIITTLAGIATILMVYVVGKSMYSRRAAALGSLLYATSFFITLSDRHSWNISFVMLVSTLTMYGLMRWLDGSRAWLIIVALVLSFGLSTTFSVMAIVIFAVLVVVFLKKPIIKKDLGVFISIVIFSHLPLVVFDLRHDFWLTKAFVEFLTVPTYTLVPFFERFLTAGTILFDALGKALVMPAGVNVSDEISICTDHIIRYFASPLLMVVSGSILVGFLLTLKGKGVLPILLLLTNFLFLFMFRADPSDRHFLPFYPFFFLMAGLILSKLKSIGIAIALGLVVVNGYAFVNSWASQGWAAKSEVVDFIISNTQAREFYLDAAGQCHKWGYRYMLTLKNHEPAASYMDEHYSWMYKDAPELLRAKVKATIVLPNEAILLESKLSGQAFKVGYFPAGKVYLEAI